MLFYIVYALLHTTHTHKHTPPTASFKGSSTNLRCLALSDTHEPGTPAAVALSVEHLTIFDGQLFPAGVDGPDSNHFLFDLYRRVGGVDCHQAVSVQRISTADVPVCCAVSSSAARPSRWLAQLDTWGTTLRTHCKVGCGVTVDGRLLFFGFLLGAGHICFYIYIIASNFWVSFLMVGVVYAKALCGASSPVHF